MSKKEYTKSYYEILGIENFSSIEEVKKAYKRLVKQYHPDVNRENNSIELYKDIVNAYTILKDPQTKAEYDQQLKNQKEINHKMKFEFSTYDLFLSTDKLLNKIKLFFKNIAGYVKQVTKGEKHSINIFEDEYSISEEILNLPLEELEDRLLYSDNKYVKINSAIAIGLKKEKKSLPVLESMLVSSSSELKKVLIWAIGNLKMKKSLNVLKILYNTSSNEIKIEILKAMYKITEGKGYFIMNILNDALKEKSEEIRIKALELLSLTNKKFEYSEIKELLKTASPKINEIINKLVQENRIVNLSKEVV